MEHEIVEQLGLADGSGSLEERSLQDASKSSRATESPSSILSGSPSSTPS
jgi:hypothetical protein